MSTTYMPFADHHPDDLKVAEVQLERHANYVRLSTSEDRQVNSFDWQETRLGEYAERYDSTCEGTFRDETSAFKHGMLERPGFKDCVEFCRANDIKTIAIAVVDRASRDLLDCMGTIFLLAKEEIRLVFYENNQLLRSDAPTDQMLLLQRLQYAEAESRSKAQRATDTAFCKRRKDELASGQDPFGWFDSGDKTLEPNPHEQYWLKWMVQQFSEGTTYGQIARALNLWQTDPEILAPSPKNAGKCLNQRKVDAGLAEPNYASSDWTTSKVKSVLRNPRLAFDNTAEKDAFIANGARSASNPEVAA